MTEQQDAARQDAHAPLPDQPADLDGPLALAATFPAATAEQWNAMVDAVLRRSGALPEDAPAGAGERALSTSLPGGLLVHPLYTATTDPVPDPGVPGSAPFVRGRRTLGNSRGGWDVRQRHDDPDPRITRKAVLADLEGGASSVWLVLGQGAVDVADLGEVLGDVHLDLAAVALDAGAAGAAAATAFQAVLADRGVDLAAATGTYGLDPIGTEARTGEHQSVPDAAELAKDLLGQTPAMRTFTVDALSYHDAGATDVEELGCALATGIAYLRALEDAGVPLEQAVDQLEFRYAATADQFLTIAKLRAARRVWARATELAGLDPELRAQRQHAVTSWPMMTRRDPWVNMLRTTLACFGAGGGGADAVTVLPFDTAIGLPDAFARRIARNTQAILLEESNAARIIDPAGGSWYVESLTEQLAQAAWQWFTEIERAGGQQAALRSGLVPDRIAASWTTRRARLATRQDPITGVSEFPLVTEKGIERRNRAEVATAGLPRHRLAEDFEVLRDRADAHLVSTGALPRVAVVAAGASRGHGAAVDLAVGAFTPAGFDVARVDAADATGSPSAPRLVCLCVTADDDAQDVARVTADLAGDGDRTVVIAAGAAVHGATLHPGADLVALLSGALDAAGVA